MPVSAERERAMQAMFSVAAMILAILGPGQVKSPGDGGASQIGATVAAYVAGWSAPDGPWKNAFFGMPRIPRPRFPQ